MTTPVEFRYETKLVDVMAALAVIDAKSGSDSRRPFHFLALGLLLWMFVPRAISYPTDPINWLFLLATGALGLFIWKGPTWQNRRYAKGLVESQTQVEGSVDTAQLTLKSKDGTTLYRLDEPIAVFEYQNVLAVNGGNGKISVIPKDQLAEETLQQLVETLKEQLEDRFQTVEQLTRGGR